MFSIELTLLTNTLLFCHFRAITDVNAAGLLVEMAAKRVVIQNEQFRVGGETRIENLLLLFWGEKPTMKFFGGRSCDILL